MSKPFIHARSHAKKFGGQPSDYIAINQFMDSSKAAVADNRHRIFFHSSFGIFTVEKLFGQDMPKLKKLAAKHNLSEEAIADIMAYTDHVRTDSVTTITNTDGKEVSVRDIAEQHILEDFNGRFIPSAQDFFNEMKIVDWMNNGANGQIPESAKQIALLRKEKAGFKIQGFKVQD